MCRIASREHELVKPLGTMLAEMVAGAYVGTPRGHVGAGPPPLSAAFPVRRRRRSRGAAVASLFSEPQVGFLPDTEGKRITPSTIDAWRILYDTRTPEPADT